MYLVFTTLSPFSTEQINNNFDMVIEFLDNIFGIEDNDHIKVSGDLIQIYSDQPR